MVDRTSTWQASLCFVLITTWLSVTWQGHKSAEFPVQSIIAVLSFCGVALLLNGQFSSMADCIFRQCRPSPALEINDENAELDFSIKFRSSQLSISARRRLLRLLVTGIVIRVGILWIISRDIQCSKKNVESAVLPSFIFVCDVVTVRRQTYKDQESDEIDDMSRNIYADLYHSFSHSLILYSTPIALLLSGLSLTSSQGLQSTYICSITRNPTKRVFICQVFGAILDSGILLGTWKLLEGSVDVKRRLTALGTILISSATILAALGTTIGLLHSGGGVGFTSYIPSGYHLSILRDSTACAVLLLCAACLSTQVHVLSLTISTTFCCISTSLFLSTLEIRASYLPQSKSACLTALFFNLTGSFVSTKMYNFSKKSSSIPSFPSKVKIPLHFFWIILFVVTAIFTITQTNEIDHPIHHLTHNALIEGDRWLTQATSSASLERAVLEYRENHHGRDPPPNFDKWYEFALQKGAPVIDNYASIDRDLLMFWAMEPAEIRRLTPMFLNSTGGDDNIALVIVRNGKVKLETGSSNPVAEADDIVNMISEFSSWLPDLAIAFNLQRSPRVSITWKKIDRMRSLGSQKLSQKQLRTTNNGFTPLADTDWLLLDQKSKITGQANFDSRGLFRPSIFDEKVAPSCPPSSSARQKRVWNIQDFCPPCASFHSMKGIINNWGKATDLCHQPDLANMHDSLSSASIDRHSGISKERLSPIFSRSKHTGYNDILFPFPETYVDPKIPGQSSAEFSDLQDKLFWRDVLSGSASSSHSWQGMQQQRLAHIANGLDPTKPILMLLPSRQSDEIQWYKYEKVAAAELKPIAANIDVGFSDSCENGTDCREQRREFDKVLDLPSDKNKTSDSDRLWNYRYVFTMDKTGGPDPMFVKALTSKSVPFHSSIYQSWYDYRLTPWLHFVPLDMRLHSLHNTIAFFSGFKGQVNGRDVNLEGRADEAAFIADQGRKWAMKALRKEDASVYAFRLLLEYGRLVDNRREEIGYTGASPDLTILGSMKESI